MEIEEQESRFRKGKDVVPMSGAEFFASENNEHFLYTYPQREERFLSRALSHAHKWLESLSGTPDIVFADRLTASHKPYIQLVEFLKGKGIVRSLSFRDRRYNDAPPFFMYSVSGCYPQGITDGEIVEYIEGIGYHRDLNIALSKAIGEFLERYFHTVYLKRNLLCGSMKSLREKGAAPIELADLAGFSEEQKKTYPERQRDEESVFWWEKVRRLSSGKQYRAPAKLIYWNYLRDPKIREPHLLEGNSSGCGGMFAKEGAILSALYEAVQRDAFLVFWLTHTPPPKIEPESVPDDIFKGLIHYARRYGFEIHCLNTTFDTTIPSFIVMIEDTYHKWPNLAIGGGCDANPKRALCRALEEAWGVYHWVRPLRSFELPHPYIPFQTPLGQLERLRLMANPGYKDQYKFFLGGPIKKFAEYAFDYPEDFPSKNKELALAIRRIERLGRGYEVYAYVSPHPLLKEVGYECARVIIPALLPLYLEERNAPLGARRLEETLLKMGKRAHEITSWPHPFG